MAGRALVVLLVMLVALVLPGPLRADQKDPRLDALFERLPEAQGAAARMIEMQIWSIWMQSPDRLAGLLLEEGAVHMQNRAYAQARKAFDAAIARAPEFAEAWNKRATLRYLEGDLDGSVQDIQHTLVLEPRHFGALTGLGLINLRLDRQEAALQAFEAALAVNPHMPGPRKYAAELREMLKRRGI